MSRPKLTLSSFNSSNTSILAGKAASIRWQDNFDENVSIRLYKNNQLYQTIATATPSDGQHTWYVPKTLPTGSDYKIRVAGQYNLSGDTSDYDFTIDPPQSIKVSELSLPNNTSLTQGQVQSINWTDNFEDNVRIELYSGGGRYSTITQSTASDGQYSWTIPTALPDGDYYYFRITNVNDASVYDQNDYFFPIKSAPVPYVNVTTPSTSSVFSANLGYTISWKDNVDSNVKIDLYKGGLFNQTIVSSTPSDGSFLWRVPANIAGGSNYQVKVSSLDDSRINDFSDGYFKLKPKQTITVNSPNGNNVLRPGSNYNLSWTDTIEENVKLELYKGSQRVQTISSSTASDGSYYWRAPSTLQSGTDYRLKVSSTTNSSVYDYSNNNFSILKDLKKYWFHYNFDTVNYANADGYSGSVIAEAGKYPIDTNHNDNNDIYFDFNSRNTETGRNGK
ncbi:MAG: Ser-Thr-rich GPI-anchored membrane family protein, partial [Bacteroidota bacterium]